MIAASTTDRAYAPARASSPPHLPRRALAVVACVVVLAGLALAVGPVQPTVAQYLAAAARDRAIQRYDLALGQYAAAHAAAPTDPRPLCDTAAVRAFQHEWPDAIASYRACLARNGANGSDNGAVWLALGDALAASGDTSGAAQAWQRAADRGARDGPRRLATAQEAAGHAAAAERAWQLLPRNDPQAVAHLGMLALWRGDLPTAQRDFLSALDRPSGDLDAIRSAGFLNLAAAPPDQTNWPARLGFAFLAIGLPQLALDPLRHAVTAGSTGAPAHAYLGWALWLTGAQAAGAAAIATARALDPKLSFAWFATGEIAAASGDLAAADTALQQALALDGNNSAIWAAEARVLLAEHDYFQADLAFGAAARLSTRSQRDHRMAPVLSGLRLRHRRPPRRHRRAGRCRPLAAKRATPLPARRSLRADAPACLLLLRRHPGARARPHRPRPHILLAQSALAAGDLVAAATELRTALALRPDSPRAGEARDLLAPIADITV